MSKFEALLVDRKGEKRYHVSPFLSSPGIAQESYIAMKKFSLVFETFLITIFSDEIDVEIFDLLMSLGDFDEFKQLMLSHKKEKTAKLNGIVEPLTVFGTNLSSSKTA